MDRSKFLHYDCLTSGKKVNKLGLQVCFVFNNIYLVFRLESPATSYSTMVSLYPNRHISGQYI